MTHPWTPAEEETFKSAFLTHFKDFQALADAIQTRNVNEVTKHFYEIRKKDHFKLHERKLLFKKRRDGIKEKNEKNAMFGPLSSSAHNGPRQPQLESQRSAPGHMEHPRPLGAADKTPKRHMTHSMDHVPAAPDPSPKAGMALAAAAMQPAQAANAQKLANFPPDVAAMASRMYGKAPLEPPQADAQAPLNITWNRANVRLSNADLVRGCG